MPFHPFIYNLTILLRKANATKECGNDVRELRCYGEFGKLCVPPEKTWLRLWILIFLFSFVKRFSQRSAGLKSPQQGS